MLLVIPGFLVTHLAKILNNDRLFHRTAKLKVVAYTHFPCLLSYVFPLLSCSFARVAYFRIHIGMKKEIEITNEIDDAAEGPEELYERMSLVVDKGQEPLRLDKFLVSRVENASRNKVQKAIENGRVLVNNKNITANYRIKPGDEIIVYSDKEVQGEEIIPQNIPLNI